MTAPVPPPMCCRSSWCYLWPGPRTGRPHGTRYRPRLVTSFRRGQQAAGVRGRDKASRRPRATPPKPPEINRRPPYRGHSVSHRLFHWRAHGGWAWGKTEKFRDTEQETGGRDPHTGASQRGMLGREMAQEEQRQTRKGREKIDKAKQNKTIRHTHSKTERGRETPTGKGTERVE